MARNYTHTSNPVQDSMGRSAVIRAEFALIDTGLTATDAEIDALTLVVAEKAGTNNVTLTGITVLPQTTSIGTTTATELGYIHGVTSPIQDQLNAKADITGEVYSGAHDFTAGTVAVPTVAYGSSGTIAASVEYVNQAAFQTVLPGQTGKDYGFLQTIGGVATWEIDPAADLALLSLGII